MDLFILTLNFSMFGILWFKVLSLNTQSQMVQEGQLFRKSVPTHYVNTRLMQSLGSRTPKN